MSINYTLQIGKHPQESEVEMEKLMDYLMIPVYLYIFPAIIAIGILMLAGFEVKGMNSTDNSIIPDWNMPGLMIGAGLLIDPL